MAHSIPPASAEQSQVLQELALGHNIIVNSVAGSGKTTTVLHVARDRDARVLLLTYNAKLKKETRDRAAAAGLRNLEVHSYHAMGFKYYTDNCARDGGLREVVEKDTAQRRAIPRYDIVVLDESQDMTGLFFAFVCKVVRDHFENHGTTPQFLVIGDENQAINAFRGADARFLTMADKLFPQNDRTWVQLHLKTSYRITTNMAAFVNEALLGKQHMVSSKEAGEPVRYLVGNPWGHAAAVAQEIRNLIRDGLCKPDDIFILTATVSSPAPKPGSSPSRSSSRTPLHVLENDLSIAYGLPCYLCARSDTQVIRSDLAEGKVTFCTINQSKGLERKYVYMIGFDENYFKFYAKDADPGICPPTMYVVCTRATQRMTLIAEQRPGQHLQFLHRSELMQLQARGCVSIEYNSPFFKNMEPKGVGVAPQVRPSAGGGLLLDREKTFFAQDMTQHLPEYVLSNAMGKLKWHKVQGAGSVIAVESVVRGKQGLPQQVSDLSGLAIPSMLEVRCSLARGELSCSMYDALKAAAMVPSGHQCPVSHLLDPSESQLLGPMHPYVKDRYAVLPSPHEMNGPAHYLELAAVYQAGANVGSRGYVSTLKQLDGFDWLPQAQAEECLQRLQVAVADHAHARFEFSFDVAFSWEGAKTTEARILGIADIVTPTCVWEVKCVKVMSEEMFIQLAIYAWLWRRTYPDSPRAFRLFNVLTGELHELLGESEAEACPVSVSSSSSAAAVANVCPLPRTVVVEEGRVDALMEPHLVGTDAMMHILLKYHFRSQTRSPDAVFLDLARSASVRSAVLSHDDKPPSSTTSRAEGAGMETSPGRIVGVKATRMMMEAEGGAWEDMDSDVGDDVRAPGPEGHVTVVVTGQPTGAGYETP